MKRLLLAGVLAVCLGVPGAGAQASTLFFNDFSSGLTAKESTTGDFAVGDGYVGHQGTFYAPDHHDSYTVNFNTAGMANPVLSFDYDNSIETGYDFLNVVDVAADLANPGATISTLLTSFTGFQAGSASFFLAPNTTSVEFNFESDSIVEFSGVKLDNVRISDAMGFFNDFSYGLSPYESVTGGFSIANGELGHQGAFYAPDANDTYTVNFNTANLTTPLLSFDLNSQIETGYDFLSVLDYTNGSATPSLLASYTGFQSGPVTLALAPQTTSVRFLFQSDSIVEFSGVQFDNVRIFDGAPAPGPAPVPEPASWVMMITGFALVGGLARRRADAKASRA